MKKVIKEKMPFNLALALEMLTQQRDLRGEKVKGQRKKKPTCAQVAKALKTNVGQLWRAL